MTRGQNSRRASSLKLGVFVPNWIGDVAMATPTLRALKRYIGPNGQMVGVVRPYVADVLSGTTWFDRQISYHPRSERAEDRFWGVLSKLREERLDTIVLLTNSLRSAGARLGPAAPASAWVTCGMVAARW